MNPFVRRCLDLVDGPRPEERITAITIVRWLDQHLESLSEADLDALAKHGHYPSVKRRASKELSRRRPRR